MEQDALDAFLNDLLLKEDLHQRILNLDGQDPAKVAMAKTGSYPPLFMARQVAGRVIARQKMPVWLEDARIAYPPKQNLGQASQYQAAAFKAYLCKGNSVADLTGGTGIDAWHIAQVSTQFLYNEPNEELFRITRHNLGLLNLNAVSFSNQSAEEILEDEEVLSGYDLIYLDPSRLDEGRKVISLKDYQPDITRIPAFILMKKKILMKLGPMLDIQETIRTLPWVRQVLVVSIKNEVKELLALSWHALDGEPIQAFELDWRGHCFRFHAEMESIGQIQVRDQTYLFEPGAALTKAGLARQYGDDLRLKRLHPEVSLYFCNGVETLFGKTYRILETLPGSPEEVKKLYAKSPVDIASRGFSMSAEQIAARHKFKTGGGQMLYFTRILEAGKDRYVCLAVEQVFF